MNPSVKPWHRLCLNIALILFVSGLLSCRSFAQVNVYRIDPAPVMTTSGNVPFGGYPALYAVAGATIQLCTDTACASPATTYTDQTGTMTCPINAPVTLPGSATCASASGPQGQFGFWITPGTYYIDITTPNGQMFGPFPVSSPNSFSVAGAGIISSSASGNLAPMAHRLDCSRYTGASASVKLAACLAVLQGLGGGTADASNFSGAQTWNSDAFSGITVPIDFVCQGTTFTVSANSTIPSNVNSYLGQGCIFSPNGGVALNINGTLNVSPLSAHFTGSGTVNLQAYAVNQFIDVREFGAKGDGSTDDTANIGKAIIAANGVATAFGGGTSAGAIVHLGPGTYVVTNLQAITSTGVHFEGAGAETTVLVTTQATGAVLTCGNGGSIADVVFEKFSIRASPARSVGATGITINGCGGGKSITRDVDLFDQPIGEQVLNTGGALVYDIEHVNVNCTNQDNGIGIDIQAPGVHVRRAFITGTTSFVGDHACFAGIRMLNTNNSSVSERTWAQYFKWNVFIAPGTGQTVTQTHFDDSVFEAATHENFAIEPGGNGTAVVWNITLNNVRIDRPFSSSIGAGPGLVINDVASPTTSVIRGITVNGSQIFGNGQDGVVIGPGTGIADVLLTANTICDNSTVSSGTYSGVAVTANVGGFAVVGNRIGYCMGQSNTQKYAFNIASGASNNYTIGPNDLRGNLTAAINDGGTGATKIILPNTGAALSFIPARVIISDNAVSTEPSISGLTPTEHLISKDATAETWLWDSFGTNNSMLFRRADGTLGSPSAVQSGEDLGHIGGGGYQSGGAYTSQRATIEFHASENWTNSNQGADIQFWDTPLGSTTPHLIGKFGDNGGNGQFLVNTSSSDFSSCILCSLGTIANVSAATNAKVLAINASGGDGKSQIVVTKSGSGTTQPLEIFSDSTLLATFQPGAAFKVAGTGQTLGTTVGTFAQLPGSPTEGDCKAISDGNSTTFMAVAAGGGANHVIVCYDGTNWRIH